MVNIIVNLLSFFLVFGWPSILGFHFLIKSCVLVNYFLSDAYAFYFNCRSNESLYHLDWIFSFSLNLGYQWSLCSHCKWFWFGLQFAEATPKTIMRAMGVKGLTLFHLKSHLQVPLLLTFSKFLLNLFLLQ